jgi:hypothetical protein
VIYVADFFASLFRVGDRALGLVRLATGVWLIHRTWAAALNFALGIQVALLVAVGDMVVKPAT